MEDSHYSQLTSLVAHNSGTALLKGGNNTCTPITDLQRLVSTINNEEISSTSKYRDQHSYDCHGKAGPYVRLLRRLCQQTYWSLDGPSMRTILETMKLEPINLLSSSILDISQ